MFPSYGVVDGTLHEQGVSRLSMPRIAPVWTLNWPLSDTSHTRSMERAEQRPETVSPAFV
jgi:hypothetical protein